MDSRWLPHERTFFKHHESNEGKGQIISLLECCIPQHISVAGGNYQPDLQSLLVLSMTMGIAKLPRCFAPKESS